MPSITERFVKSLKPPESGYKLHGDDVNRGFGVRINANGTRSFYLIYTTVDGRERRFKIGEWPAMSADEARNQALTLREEIRKGGDPVSEREAALHGATISDLASEYMKVAEKKLRPGTLRNDRGLLKNIIEPKLGKMMVKAVTRRDVERLHASLRSTPAHANRVLALLSTMFNHAIDWKLVEGNPVKGVQRYEETKRETWLSLEQLQALESALAKYPDQVAADALRLLIVTGSREMEVLSATWDQFDLKRGVWTKPSHHTKQKKTEHVPLNRAAMAILSSLPRTSRFLFPGAKPNEHRVVIRKPWAQVLRSAGLATATIVPSKRKGMTKTVWRSSVRVHDLRHSFASHLVSGGASLYLVGKLLGHVRPETTARYAHASDQALRDVTNAFPLLSAQVN
ncbi:MAG: tyrosine-type recombinase/integrase [Acidobacteriia bacterium]|nr:tyrosine-type recombinase/integrase [Terriglobia bacterium]